MRITEISFEAVFNLGDYENEKIRLTAQLEEGDSPEEIIDQLRKKAIEKASIDADKTYNRRWQLEHDLKELEKRINQKRDEWNGLAEFLRVQGLKPDAPTLAPVQALLPQVIEEKTSTVIGELNF